MKLPSLVISLLLAGSALAQTAPSDSLFNTDQVVTVNLTFSDPMSKALTRWHQNP